MSEAKKYIDPYKAVFILVGCKRDISDTDAKNREINESEARAFANFHNIPYVETSAKSGLNVEDAFAILTQSIYDKIETGEYKVDGNWDGIKRGFFPLNNNATTSSNRPSRNLRTNDSIVTLREAQPESKLCCWKTKLFYFFINVRNQKINLGIFQQKKRFLFWIVD